jgi:DNA-binding NarL/FixJ family response regulator
MKTALQNTAFDPVLTEKPDSFPIDVALVDDNPTLRATVLALLRSDNRFRIVAECADGETALQLLPKLLPEIVLMDIVLPNVSGIECVRELKTALPDTQFMMLTVFEEYDRIFESLRAGATSYLLKRNIQADLLSAIVDLQRGGSPMSNSIARKVVLAFAKMAPGPKESESLTLREEEVVKALAAGRLYKEIAEEMAISFHTVRAHVQNIYKKLQVCSRAEAIRKFASQPRT